MHFDIKQSRTDWVGTGAQIRYYCHHRTGARPSVRTGSLIMQHPRQKWAQCTPRTGSERGSNARGAYYWARPASQLLGPQRSERGSIPESGPQLLGPGCIQPCASTGSKQQNENTSVLIQSGTTSPQTLGPAPRPCEKELHTEIEFGNFSMNRNRSVGCPSGHPTTSSIPIQSNSVAHGQRGVQSGTKVSVPSGFSLGPLNLQYNWCVGCLSTPHAPIVL